MKQLLAAAAFAFAAFSAPAFAATYDRLTMVQLKQVFAAGGYSAQTTSNSEVIQVGDTYVWLTDCNASAGSCAEIQFFRNFADVRPTLDAVNTWNNSRKIPEASINSDGTLHLEMWMSAIGATETSIVDTLGWFDKTVADVNYWGPYIVSGATS